MHENIADWFAWVGRTETKREQISLDRVSALAATLGWGKKPEKGDLLPPGWQWLFFNPVVRRQELGEDGHPQKGGFLPPIDLPRRMWAGSRVSFLEPLLIGADAERRSEILEIKTRDGRSGRLVFVTVRHIISSANVDCILEDQDLVYREAVSANSRPPAQEPAPEGADYRKEIQPDTVLLFRYSALTFNGHRIHYDLPYAKDVEGYPNLVVHGPLTATLLQDFAISSCGRNTALKMFEFRGRSPLFVGRPFTLEAKSGGDENSLQLWVRGPEGEYAMQASASF